jgi:hypothetical protein
MQRHLLHVGYPKAGSTTLQAWFGSRPELVFADDAVGGVTSAEAIAAQVAASDGVPQWLVTSAERLILPAIEGRGLTAPAEPIAERRQRVCARLRAMFGDATVLIVTRGFRSIIASSYSQTLRWGPAMSIDEFLSLAQESPEFEGALDYDAALRLYADTFGEQNVVVLPFELLRDDPRGFLARLEQRLGLEHRSDEAPWRNASLSGAEQYWYLRFSRGVESATARLGRPGTRLRRAYYQRAIRAGRLKRPAEVLSRVSRMPSVNPADEIPDDVVEICRGLASSLATNPDYAPYAAEYLNDR